VNLDKFVAAVRELKHCWFAELILAAADDNSGRSTTAS
jgi:hypothetical protein